MRKEIKGCHECANNDYKRGCLIGNNEASAEWWNANGKKIPSVDKFDDMPCYSIPESSKMLDDMSELIDKMSNLI